MSNNNHVIYEKTFWRDGKEGPGSGPVPAQSARQFSMKMINHFAVFVLGAEEDYLGVHTYFNGVAWRPIEKISSGNNLFMTVRVSDGDFTFDHVAPVRSLAQIVLKSFQQRCDIHARSQ